MTALRYGGLAFFQGAFLLPCGFARRDPQPLSRPPLPLHPPRRATPQNHAREVALSFRHSVPCEAGQLVVLPLRQEWVSAAADILTESFAQSMGYLKPYE